MSTDHEIMACFKAKRENAKQRKIHFDMSFISFKNLKEQTHCQYSGFPFSDKHEFSFERIDNNIGYVDGNVIVVSRAINTARSNYTTESLPGVIARAEQELKTYPVPQLPKLENWKPKLRKNQMSAYLHNVKMYNTLHNLIKKCESELAQIQTDITKPGIKPSTRNNLKQKRDGLNGKIAKSKNSIKNIEHDLMHIYSKGQRISVNKQVRPNTFQDHYYAHKMQEYNNMQTRYEYKQSRVLFLKYALLGLLKIENLNQHEKNCLRTGLAFDSSPEKVNSFLYVIGAK